MPREPQGAGYVLYRYRKSLIAFHGSYLAFLLLGVASEKVIPFTGELPFTVISYAFGLSWFFFGVRLNFLLQADSLRPWVHFRVVVLPFLLGIPLVVVLNALIN